MNQIVFYQFMQKLQFKWVNKYNDDKKWAINN